MPPGSTKSRSPPPSCSARCSHPTTFMTLPKSGSGCSASSTATSRPQSPSTGSTPALTWIGYCAASMRASSSAQIPQRFVDYQPVDCLPAADARDYLERVGVADERLRSLLIDYSSVSDCEVHPYFLGLCAD